MLYFGEPVAVPDPDLAGGGGGGGQSPPKNYPAPLGLSLVQKNKEAGGADPWAPPLDLPLSRASINVLAYITRMDDTLT